MLAKGIVGFAQFSKMNHQSFMIFLPRHVRTELLITESDSLSTIWILLQTDRCSQPAQVIKKENKEIQVCLQMIFYLDCMNIIENFYTSFAKGDWQAMANCYHPEAEFTDEVFVGLKGKEVPGMWRMLIERGGGNMEITYSHVQETAEKGSADWVAVYLF